MPLREIEAALRHADETKSLQIGEAILKQIPEIFRTQFPAKKAVVIADRNTYQVAGASAHQFLSDAGLAYESPFVIDDPDLYANYPFVQKVKQFLASRDAIAVAVGSGVINDLTKLASHELGRAYMCVATAASMDGYSAFGASITKNGAKQTMACSAPRAIVADLAIIAQAPVVNNASGFADLYAKVPAGADWIFADAMGAESLDATSWHIVQDGLKDALRDPEGIKAGDPAAIGLLTEGLMLGGFAMQSLKSSRPASGAEHQFSHSWDMAHHTFKGEMARIFGLYPDQDEQAPSHGFKVGIGLLTTTALYEQILQTPLEQLDVKKAVDQWKPLADQIRELDTLFEEPGVKAFAAEQLTGKYIDQVELEKQLNDLKKNWPELKEKLRTQLIPYAESKERLRLAGAPVDCEQIGISRSRLKKTFYIAQKLRSRFTVLDVGVRTQYLDQWVAALFAEGGPL